MRTLNELEMRVAAGGVQPMTVPEPRPCSDSRDLDIWRIRMQLLEPEVGDNSSL